MCGGGGGKNLSPAWAGLKGGFSVETERIVKYFVNYIKMFRPSPTVTRPIYKTRGFMFTISQFCPRRIKHKY